MSRHKLSLEEQLEGVRAALRSRRTPPQLKEGLRRREAELKMQLANSSWSQSLFGANTMATKRAFISYDFDHDKDLRTPQAGQTKHPETQFNLQEVYVKETMPGDWRDK